MSVRDLSGRTPLARRVAVPPGSAVHAPVRGTARVDLDAILGQAAPDRLAAAVLAYLGLPGLLFLVGWTEPWVALLAGGAGAAALACVPGWHGGTGWPLGAGMTTLCLVLGLAWASATGALHLVYATADWQIRDAVLRDLAGGPWPVAYANAADGAHWLLRAPLGFFLPAGLVGRGFGFHAAQGALWIWAGLGLGLVLSLLATLAQALAPARPARAFAVLALVFVLFHGLDILPNVWLDWHAGAGLLASWGRGGEWWARLFQYSGHVTALLWAPNHALPAWLAALLLLRHWRSLAFLRGGVALSLAAAAFWSPIAAAGAALLSVAATIRGGMPALRAAATAPVNWLAVAFAMPLCVYLIAGAEAVPHGPLFAAHPPAEALECWAMFLGVEVLAWAALAAMLVRGWLFGLAIALLCLLPAYVFGPGNEMTSRGGMAPLAVLAVACGAALLVPVPRQDGRGHCLARVGLLACAALGAAGALMESSLLLTKSPWPASGRCSVPEAARQSVFQGSTNWSHYLAPWPDRELEGWLEQPELRPVPPPGGSPPCWPQGGV